MNPIILWKTFSRPFHRNLADGQKRKIVLSFVLTWLLIFQVQSSNAACTVCNGKTGKCYSFKTLNCKDFGLGRGDSCIQGKAYTMGTATGFTIKSADLPNVTRVLNEKGVDFLGPAPGSTGPVLIVVDGATSVSATSALKQAKVAFKTQAVPQVSSPVF
jgi:hypothetical protein